MARLTLLDAVSVAAGVVLLALNVLVLVNEARSVVIGLICAVICFVPTLLKRSGLIEVPGPLASIIVASAFLHGAGLMVGCYDRYDEYDTVTHTLSSMTVGVIAFYTMLVIQLCGNGRVNFTGRGLAVFVAMITLSFSVYWEVIEYFSDLLLSSTAQYSPHDTVTDLVCDSLGTILASVWVWLYMRGRTVDDVVASFHLDGRILAAVSKVRSS